ncbi:hypothetical protein KDA11_04610, partial [Candidatus Saccharibacteria bacterium]|nr:hypothetical protein [Candidatus Saccharibacteria bacterium]
MEIKKLNIPLAQINLHFWRSLAEWLGALSVCVALFSFRLHTLVPGFSSAEMMAIGKAASLKTIGHDPTYLAHKLLQYIGLKLDHNGFIAMRLPSVLAGIVAVALFFYIINKWFNLQIAITASFLFVSSSWFLHLARIGTPEVTYLGILAPLAFAVWLTPYRKPLQALSLGLLVLLNALYTPGLIWFVIFSMIWQRKVLTQLIASLKIPSLFMISGVVILLTPLFLSLIQSPELIKAYFGLPSNLAQSPFTILQNLINIPIMLAWRGPNDPALNLGRMPLLDFFTFIMVILGGYSFAKHAKLQRSQMLLACLIISFMLLAIGGQVSIAILLPFVYLLTAGGI